MRQIRAMMVAALLLGLALTLSGCEIDIDDATPIGGIASQVK